MKKIFWIIVLLVIQFVISGCNQAVEITEYTVTYHFNNGDEDYSIKVAEGQIFAKINKPINPGHRFIDWYQDESFNQKYDFNKKVTSDLDLYAKWEVIETTKESIVPVFKGLSVENIKERQNLKRNENKDITGTVDEFGGYANVNEDIIINIHIDNPDEYVILRFILNGTTYQAYQFEEGSNSNLIKLKVNVGSIPGKYDYKIDEIKYVDDLDNQIKDVKMEGKKVITVGVAYDILPDYQDLKIDVTEKSIEFSVTISDYYSIANDNIYLYFFDEEKLLNRYSLSIGINQILIDGLTVNTKYHFFINATYDCLNGQGRRTYILIEDDIQTKDIDLLSLELKDVKSDQVTIDIIDNYTSTFEKLELYQEDILVKTYNYQVNLLNELDFNTNYVLKIYSYVIVSNQKVQKINELSFTTLPLAVPTLSLFDFFEISETYVTFHYAFRVDYWANNYFYEVVAVNLYLGDDLVSSSLEDVFTSLTPGTNYKIEIVLNYGITNKIVETKNYIKEFQTDASPIPGFSIVKLMINDTFFEWRGATSGNANLEKIKVYDNEQLIWERAFTNYIVGGLSPDTEYKVEYWYSYDTDNGLEYGKETIDIKTKKYYTPQIMLFVYVDYDTILLEMESTDLQDTIEIESIILYKENQEVQRLTKYNDLRFYCLELDTLYRVEVTYKCLVNGEEVTNVETGEIKTPVKDDMPYAKLINLDISYDSVSFEKYVVDPNNQITVRSISLVDNMNEIQKLENFDDLKFEGLLTWHDYQLCIKYTINQNGEILHRDHYTSFKTLDPEFIPAEIKLNVSKNYLTYSIDNKDQYGYQGVTKVEVYSNNQLINSYQPEETGTIVDLDYNTEYQLKVTYSFNLNDGYGDRKQTIIKDFITGLEVIPVVKIKILNYDQKSVSYKLEIENNIKSLNIKSLYFSDEFGFNSQSFDNYGSFPTSFNNLLSNRKYSIYLEYSYYEYGLENNLSDFVEFTTTKYEMPILNVDLHTEGNKIIGEIEIKDPDKIGYLKKIELYQNNLLVSTYKIDGLFNNAFIFDNLEINEYSVKVVYGYDLNEGYGEELLQEENIIKVKALE